MTLYRTAAMSSRKENPMDTDVPQDEKEEFLSDGDAKKLIARFCSRKLSEVKLVWPLHDGHTIEILASRRLTEAEFETLENVIHLGQSAFSVVKLTGESIG